MGLNSLYVLNRYCTHPFRIASNCLLPVEMRTSHSEMPSHSIGFHHSNGTPPPAQESRPHLNRQQAFAEAFDFQESFAGGAVNGLDEWLDGMGLDCAWGHAI
jgi:hypothetical protein